MLPWWSGAIAGGLLSLFVFGFAWLGASQITASNTGSVATHLFTGLLAFTPPGELFGAGTVIANLSPEAARSMLLGDLASGRYDAVLGVVYLAVAYVLYASGRTFARWYARDDDGAASVASGVTVAAGTAPVVAVVAVAFGGEVVTDIAIAGILVPAGLGVAGASGTWAFRRYRRLPSWGGGFLAGLVGLLLVFGLTLIWGPDAGVGLGEGLLARLTAALAAFVGVTTWGFDAGTTGLLAYVVVAVPVLVFGYFRARRSQPVVDGPLEGARAGATLVAGFSGLAFGAVTGYVILATLWSAAGPSAVNPLLFLPEAAGSQGGSAVPVLVTLGSYLEAFVVGGIVFPLVVGGVGGTVGGFLESRPDGDRQPRGDQRQQPGNGRGQQTGRGRQPQAGHRQQSQAGDRERSQSGNRTR